MQINYLSFFSRLVNLALCPSLVYGDSLENYWV